MADKTKKFTDNAPGKYYIDDSCIFCNLCLEVAPNHYKESEQGDHDIVAVQPQSEQEIALCEDAKSQCPVDAIGNDGE